MARKRGIVNYLDDFVPREVDTRLMYYGPNYNRICARCNDRWVSGEMPETMLEQELEIEKCPACSKRSKSVFTRLHAHDRERQLDHIQKFKGV